MGRNRDIVKRVYQDERIIGIVHPSVKKEDRENVIFFGADEIHTHRDIDKKSFVICTESQAVKNYGYKPK